ncbi:hypothetical protein [Streptomyces sp. 900105245]
MVLRETKKDALESGFMPRARLLDRSKPLEAFAADLRRLRDSAPPRRLRKKKPGPLKNGEPAALAPLTVDQVVAEHEVGRSSIYAALSGRRLPSTMLLRVMVLAWDPKGADAIPQWMDRRRQVEAALSLEDPVPRHSTLPVPAGDTGKPVEPDAPEPAPAGRPEPARSFPSQAPASSPLSTEIKRLYEAAGSPSVRQISAAVLTDSQSADISPETVRRVVAGTHARRTSVASVVRALAAINGADVSAAEERALGLRTLEESTTDVDPGLSVTAADPARVDLRGAVIHGLHLIAGDGQTIDLRHAVLNGPVVRAGDGQTFHVTDSALNDAVVRAGDGQTFHVTDSALNDVAVRAGDGQTFHLSDSTLNDAVVRAGDRQALHVSDSALNDAVVRAGGRQTFHLSDSTLNDVVVCAGDRQTSEVGHSALNDVVVRGEGRALPAGSGTRGFATDAAKPWETSVGHLAQATE